MYAFALHPMVTVYLLNHMCLGRRSSDGLYWRYRCHIGRGQGGCLRGSCTCCRSYISRLQLCMMMVRLLLLVVRRVRVVRIKFASIAIVLCACWTWTTQTRKVSSVAASAGARHSWGRSGGRRRGSGDDRSRPIVQISKSRWWLQMGRSFEDVRKWIFANNFHNWPFRKIPFLRR